MKDIIEKYKVKDLDEIRQALRVKVKQNHKDDICL